MMEEINRKSEEDELNKNNDNDFGKAPRKFIPVPKVKKEKQNDKNKQNGTKR